jgi:hypothetical protein
MKTALFALMIFVAVLFYSNCNTKKEQPKVDVEVEVIDFFSFNKLEVEEIPIFVIKNKKYIKLDGTNGDYLFKKIDKISIVDDRIYVLDRRLKKLIVFDTTGTGIGCVGKRGQGPGEYLQITDFSVNDRGDIYIIDGTADNDRLFVFDRRRQFISVKRMPFEANVIQCLPDDKLLFGLAPWNKERKSASRKIAITNLELDIERVYGEYDEYVDINFGISHYLFINTGDRILYNKPIDNYVYEFSLEGQLQKACFFDFGKKNVPNEYRKDIESNLDKFEHYCCLKNFAVVNDKYILGTLWDGAKTKIFIVDKNDKTVYLSKKEIADADNSNFTGYCNNQIISYIYPGKYDDIQATDFPVDVKAHVEDENFVLCLYTLK